MSTDTLRRLTLAEACALIGPKDEVYVADRGAFLLSFKIGAGVGRVAVGEDPAVPPGVLEIRRGGKVRGRIIAFNPSNQPAPGADHHRRSQ